MKEGSVDISLLIFKDGQWVYRSTDQLDLVEACATLLNWDLYTFDRWLFDSQNWSMYTRRRQDLIALRGELALAFGKTSDPTSRELLMVNYCLLAWKSTRAMERKDCPEVQELELAHARAKKLYKTLKLTPHARRMQHPLNREPVSRLLRNSMAYGQ
jgi:hypothetical protein